jgi:hypothetical protein
MSGSVEGVMNHHQPLLRPSVELERPPPRAAPCAATRSRHGLGVAPGVVRRSREVEGRRVWSRLARRPDKRYRFLARRNSPVRGKGCSAESSCRAPPLSSGAAAGSPQETARRPSCPEGGQPRSEDRTGTATASAPPTKYRPDRRRQQRRARQGHRRRSGSTRIAAGRSRASY